MRNNPEATRRMGRVHKLATLDSHPCRVESVHHI
jgi:hypothetical protein